MAFDLLKTCSIEIPTKHVKKSGQTQQYLANLLIATQKTFSIVKKSDQTRSQEVGSNSTIPCEFIGSYSDKHFGIPDICSVECIRIENYINDQVLS